MAGSRLKNLRSLFKRIGFYSPVTIYFVLFSAAGILGYRWLHELSEIPDSSYKDVLVLLLSLALLIGCCILCLGMLTVCFSYFFLRWKQNRTGVIIRVSASGTQRDNKQTISILIHPILQPILGYIRIRLNYDGERYSKKFDLVNASHRGLIATRLEGSYSWDLPEIREYRIENALIYFEDFFQFFSFAAKLPAANSFYTAPSIQDLNSIPSFPRKTEEQKQRIEELKKIEGEYINYKNFENSDDVRRIVWKIYAKNKELVVRIPEVLDPYASHIYFYASFFSSFNEINNEVIQVPFLNYYKTLVWSLYKQYEKKGFEVRFIADQPVPTQPNDHEEHKDRYAITLSSWHQDLDLKSYFNPKDAAVVVLSSLSDANQVKELIERYGHAVTIVYVNLSESMSSIDLAHWLQWIFIEQEKDKTAVYKSSWRLSTLRLKIEENEKRLKELLKDQHELVRQ